MSEENIIRKSAEEIADMESRTDWERVDALTDEEIERAVADDPDAELLDEEWFRTAKLIVPSGEKKRITIRLDEGVIDYFKREGKGYQTRINEVLKTYVFSQKLKEDRDDSPE